MICIYKELYKEQTVRLKKLLLAPSLSQIVVDFSCVFVPWLYPFYVCHPVFSTPGSLCSVPVLPKASYWTFVHLNSPSI